MKDDTMTDFTPFTAFPGHAGRFRPLTRWRSLARMTAGDINEC